MGEKIEGVNTYHYKHTVNKEGVKDFFVRIGEIVESPLTEEDLAGLDDSLASAKDFGGEIWIRHTALFLRRHRRSPRRIPLLPGQDRRQNPVY